MFYLFSFSLVIQWRFVNRIQKQMAAFKEVRVVFHLLPITFKPWASLCLRQIRCGGLCKAILSMFIQLCVSLILCF